MKKNFILKPKSEEDIIKELNNLTQKEKDKKLIYASENCNKEAVKFLIKAGANINAKDNNGITALMRASRYGEVEVVKLLIEAGADNGYTALMEASDNNYVEVVKLLIENGANINVKDKFGNTALIYASRYDRKEIVYLLKRYGAKE